MALVHDSPNDFVLYPKDRFHSDMAQSRAEGYPDMAYPINEPPSTLPQVGELERSTYDTYPAVSAFTAAPSMYYNVPPYPQQTIKGNQQPRYTPAPSPSPSISQGLEHPPSTLSSTSGASVQSTASSAVGSPYAHATHNIPGQEWTEAQQGLGIAPGIVHNDAHGHDPFPLLPMDTDFNFDEHKFSSSFVGESTKVSSTSSAPSSHTFSPPNSLSSPSQSYLSIVPSSPFPLQTPVVQPSELTIDTILEEATRKIDSPIQLGTPVSEGSAKPSPKTDQVAPQPRRAASLDQHTFVSPTIPASALSPFPRRTSPIRSRRPGPRRRTMPAPDDRHPTSGPPPAPSARYAPYARPMPPVPPHLAPPPMMSDTVPPSSPFLGPGTGAFGMPAQTSCRFPYLSLTHSPSLLKQRLLRLINAFFLEIKG